MPYLQMEKYTCNMFIYLATHSTCYSYISFRFMRLHENVTIWDREQMMPTLYSGESFVVFTVHDDIRRLKELT